MMPTPKLVCTPPLDLVDAHAHCGPGLGVDQPKPEGSISHLFEVCVAYEALVSCSLAGIPAQELSDALEGI